MRGFLGFGRALLLAATLLSRGLLQRSVRALCRNGGGLVGRFFVRYGWVGHRFLRSFRT
jgi:hypothetical protein